jgi:hypothetical protein
MNQKNEGLYNKYYVERNDGRDSIGQDRENAVYFVLDITYDKYARVALMAYACACQKDYPKLADDISDWLKGD